MQDLFGTWGPEIVAYSKQNPLRVVAFVLNVGSIALTLMFGKFSPLSGGDDFSGFGDSDGDCGD